MSISLALDGREVGLEALGVLARVAAHDALDVAEAGAGDPGVDAALGVVVDGRRLDGLISDALRPGDARNNHGGLLL